MLTCQGRPTLPYSPLMSGTAIGRCCFKMSIARGYQCGFRYRPDCTLRKVRLEHRMKGDISAGDHAHLDDPRGSIDFRIAKPAHLFR
jgi:hypothetical protein